MLRSSRVPIHNLQCHSLTTRFHLTSSPMINSLGFNTIADLTWNRNARRVPDRQHWFDAESDANILAALHSAYTLTPSVDSPQVR